MSVNKYYRVEERFQFQARSRRLRQQLRDGKFKTFADYKAAVAEVIKDYGHRNDMPIFIDTPFVEVMKESPVKLTIERTLEKKK